MVIFLNSFFLKIIFILFFYLQQAALDKGKDWKSEASYAEDVNEAKELVESVVSQMNELGISANSSAVMPPSISTESSAPGDHVPDIDKRIRALKKKVKNVNACRVCTTCTRKCALFECSLNYASFRVLLCLENFHTKLVRTLIYTHLACQRQ